MDPRIKQVGKRLDGLYYVTRAKIVSEYYLRPVRFFSIFFALLVFLGGVAFFQPIRAFDLFLDQHSLQSKYPHFRTLEEQRKVAPTSDKYFTGEYEVIQNSKDIGLNVGSGGKDAQISISNAHEDMGQKSEEYKKSIDIKRSKSEEVSLSQKTTNGVPGLFKVKAQDKHSGATTAEKTVAWGVLAFNPDYSIYPTDTTAAFSMAVLDDRGKMICDASLTLEITDPAGNKQTLSTENKLILVNEACLVYGPTVEPDYISQYKTGPEGEYKVTLTARVGKGVRILHDTFSVKNKQPFYLQRVGATRTYPNADYTYNLNFQPRQDGHYQITEIVPAEFILSGTNADVKTVGDVKKLTWEIDAKKNNDQTLRFSFKGPFLSPHLYNFGPATVKSTKPDALFTEPRKWQIASDAPPTVDWDGSASSLWSDGANWSTGAIPQAGDNLVFPAGAANKSNTNDLGDNMLFNSITFTDSGYTLAGNTIIVGQGLNGVTDAAASGGNTISLNLRVDATRWFTVTNNAESLTISGAIAGAGGLTKEGFGKLILSGGNTYGGVTKVNLGTISARNNTALGTIATGTEVVGEAALELQGTIAIGREPLTLRGYGESNGGALRNTSNNNSFDGLITVAGIAEIQSDSGTLTLNGGVTGATIPLVIDGAGNVTFDKAPIANTSGLVTKNGAGTLTYNFPNTYTGITTVNAGTLAYGVDNAILSGGITINGGTVDIATFSDMVGAIILGTPKGDSATITGSTGVLSSTGYTAYAGTISAIIAGDAAAFGKSSPGTVTLTKANLFTGATTISAGILKIQNSTALGTIDGATTMSSGGTLQIDGNGLSVPEYISLTGVGALNQGAIKNSTGNNTITGQITLATTATVKADTGTTITYATGGFTGAFGLTVNGDGNTNISGPIAISSGALTKDGPGTLTLSTFNPYTGATTINNGTLTLNSYGAITMSASIAINSNGKLIVDNSSVVTDRIGDAVGVTMNGGSWDFYGSSSTNTMATAGALTMASGKNTLTVFAGTGGYTIMRFASFSRTAGARGLIRGASLGSTPAANVATVLFTTAPTLIGDDNVAGTPGVSIIQGVFGDNSTSGTGTDMVTYGRGNNNGLRLLNGAGFSNEYTTDFSITNANIKITSATAAATSQINSLILGSGASITDAGSAQTITFMSGNILNLQAGGSIAGANTTFAAGSVEFSISTPQSLDWSGLITTTGGLTKGGAGTLTFSTAKTYTGLTAITDGTFLYGINDAISTGAVTVNDATLNIATYTDSVGAVIVQGGTLTGSTGVLTAASYDFRAATIDAIIDGSGTTTISNTNERSDAVTTMSRDNTYTGSTAVSSGVLKLTGAGGGTNTPLGTTGGSTTVTNGAAIDLNGYSLGTSESITINGQGIGFMGAMTNSSSSTATYSGNVAIGVATRIGAMYGKIIISGGISGAFGITFDGYFDVDVTGVISTITTVTKEGFGTYTPSNSNSYASTTTINAGTLKLGAAGGGVNTPLGTTAGATAVASGATLDLNGYTLGTAEAITNLSGVGGGSGDFAPGALVNSSASAVSYSGTITIAAGTMIRADFGAITLSAISGSNTGLVLAGSTGGTVSGVIGTGSGTLTKLGTGTWNLAGSSTFTGATSIYQGTIQLGATGGATNTPLGTTGGATTVFSGGVLDLNGNTLGTAEGLTINGFGIANGGAMVNNSGSGVTYSGTRALGSDARTTNSGAGLLTLSGAQSGVFESRYGGAGNTTISVAIAATASTLLKDGAGTLNLTAANGHTGTTTVIAGTIAAGINNALSSGALVVNGGTYDIATFTDTVGAVTLIDGIITGSSGVLTATGYTLEHGTVSGIIAGAVAVTKNTPGSVAITSTSTVSSTLTINAGTVTFSGANGSATSITAVTVNLGGTLTLDNASANNTNRLGSITITMNGGNLNYIGSSSTNASETLGQLAIAAGHNVVTETPGAGGTTTLTWATNPGLNRTGGATVLFRGTDFGANAAANVSTMLFSTAPTLVGASGGSGTTTISVIKGAYGDGSLTGTGTDMVTYNVGNTNGLRLLNGAGFSGEYAADFQTNNSNIKITSNTTAATIGVNSLIINGGDVTDAGSAQTLTIANGTRSGNILIASANNIAGANTTIATGVDIEIQILANASSTISAVIGSGSTPVTISGSGNLTLSATNTYAGNTVINNATLTEGASDVLSTGGVTIVGGIFDLNGNSESVGAITMTAGTAKSGAGTLTTTGTLATVANANKSSIITGTLAVPAAATLNIADGLVDNDAVISATITGAGTSLTKSTGTGVVVLGGSNTNAGSIAISAGTLRLGAAGGGTNTPLGTTGGATTVSSGAALDLNGYTLGIAEGLTISGTGISTTGALLNTSSTAVDYSGTITLGAAVSIYANYGDINLTSTGSTTGAFALTLRGAGNGSYAGVMANVASSIVKNDLGTWTVSGASQYTGVTTITAGVFKLGGAGSGSNTPLGTTSSATTVASGAMLDLNGYTLATAEAITISGTGIANAGAITTSSGSASSYSGAITMGAAVRITNYGTGTFSFSGALSGNQTFTPVTSPGTIAQTSASVWSGSGTLTKEGSGTLTLAGQNSMTGAMTVSTGTLQVAANGGAANTPLGTIAGGVTVSSGAVLDLSTFVVGGASTWEPLTLSGSGLKTTGALISSSTSNNSFGATTISANARIINSGSGIINLTGTVTMAASINLGVGGSGPTTISGALGATATSATLTKWDAGTLILSGTNIITGLFRVNGGTLQLSSGAAISTNNVTVAGGTFDFNGITDTVGAVALVSGTLTDSNGTPGALTGTSYTFNGGAISGVLAGAVAMAKNTGDTLTINKTLSNSGTLTVNAGSVQFLASNILNGAVVIAGGTLDIGSNTDTVGAVTLTSGSIIGAGTLTGTSYAVASGSIGAILAGAVNLTKTTSGTVTLSGTNTYSGVTTISGGTLSVGTIGNGGVAGNLGQATNAAANIVFNTGTGTLAYTGATASTDRNYTTTNALTANFDITSPTTELTMSGVSTSTTALIGKIGPGTLIAAGANQNTGTTSVLAGTFKYGAANAILTGAVTVTNGTLDLNNFSDSVGTLTMTNGGQIVDTGGSTAVLTSTATFALQSGKVSARLGSAVGGGINKTTTDRVILSGDNTFTSTTIALSAGYLNLQSNNALGASGTSLTLTITSGAVLETQNTVTIPSTKVFTINGTGINAGGAIRNVADSNTLQGAITLGATGVRINSFSGTLTMSANMSGSGNSITFGGAGNLTYSGVIGTVTGTLTKDGTGTLTLSNANTYQGVTTISAGVVAISNNTSFGTTAGNVTVASGAAINMSNNITVGAEALSINGTGVSSNGAIRNTADSNTWQGAVTLASTSSVGSDAGTLTLSGTVTGAGSIGLTKVGAATVSVTNTVSLGGDLIISAGTLSASSNNISVGGDYTNSGTFTSGSSTVIFTATDAGNVLSGTMTGGSQFSGITFNGTGSAAWSVNNALTAVGTFSLEDGALTQGANIDFTLYGNVSITSGASFTAASGSGKFIMDGDAGTETFTDATSPLQDLGAVQIGLSPGTTNLASDMSAKSLTIPTGDRLNTKGYDVTLTTFFDAQGTAILDTTDTGAGGYEGDGSIISVAGDWTFSGTGTYTLDTDGGTPTKNLFNGAADQTITTGGITFYQVELNNTGAGGSDDVIISGALDVNGTFTITDGDLDTNTNDINTNVANDFTIGANGSIDAGSGTWTFDPTGTKTWTDNSAAKWSPGLVTIGSGSSTPTINLGSTVEASTVTIAASHTLALQSSGYTLELSGTGTAATVLTVSGTLAPGTDSTVKYSATNSGGNVTVAATTYRHLQLSGAETYDLGANLTSANAIPGNLTIDSGATLDAVSGSNYNIELAGNYSNGGSFTARSGTVTLNGTSTQTLSGGMLTTNAFYNLVVSNNSGTNPSDDERTSFVASVDFDAAATATNGFTANAAHIRLEFGNGLRYTFANINIQGTSGAGNLTYLRNSAAGSGAWELAVSGTQTVSYVNVSRSNASFGSAVSAYDGTNVDANNNTNWSFVASVIVSGTCDQYDQTTDCTDDGANQIRVAINGSLDSGVDTTVDGSWSVSLGSLPVTNDIITIFIDGETTDNEEAVAVTKYDGTGDITGVVLYQRHLTLGSVDNPTLSNSDIDAYDNSVSGDEDIFFDVSAGDDLTVDSVGSYTDEELYTLSGATYRPASGGGADVTTVHVENDGTWTADSNLATVAGSWQNDGTFTAGSGTVTFSSTSSGRTLSGTLSGSTGKFNILNFDGVSGGWTLNANLETGGAMTVTNGTLNTHDTNSYSVTVAGNYTMQSGATVDGNASTFTVSGNWDQNNSTWNTAATGSGTTTVVLDGASKTLSTNGTSSADRHFYSLTINGSYTATTGERINIQGNFIMNTSSSLSNIEFSPGLHIWNGSATVTINGTMSKASSNNGSMWIRTSMPTITSSVGIGVRVDYVIGSAGTHVIPALNYNGGLYFNSTETNTYRLGSGTFNIPSTDTGWTILSSTAAKVLTLDNDTFDSTVNVTSNIDFTSAAGSVTANLGSASYGVGQSWINTDGATINPGTSTVTFSNDTNDGDITSASQSFYNVIIDDTGDDITPTDALSITNDLTLTAGEINSAQNVTVNGNVGGTAGFTNFSGGTFTQRVAANKNFGATTGSTAWTFSSLTFSNSHGSSPFTITTQTGGTGGINVTGVLRVGASGDSAGATTTLDAGNRTWTLSSTGGDPFQILASPLGVLSGGTSKFYYTGANAGGNTTIQASASSYYDLELNAADTFVLEGATLVSNNLTITTGTLDTVSGQNYALTIGGNYSNAGTFTAQLGTVTFSATDTGNTLSGTLSGSSSFYDLTFNGSGGEWTPSAAVAITNDLTMTAGSLLGTQNVTVNGTVVGTAGIINLTGGTFEQRVAAAENFGATTGSAAWTFSSLTFSNSHGSSPFTITTQTGGTGTITVSSVLRVGKSGDSAGATTTLDAGNRTWTLPGTSGDPFQILASPAGVLTAGTSTFTYTGNYASDDTVVQVATYYNLIVNNGSETYALEGNTTVGHDATITAGVLALSGSTLTITNDLSVAGTLSGANNVSVAGGDATGNGTINLSGGTFTITGTGNFGGDTAWTFNGVTIGASGGSASTITATGTGGMTLGNTLSITARISGANVLEAGSKIWTLGATNGSPFCSGGALVNATLTAQTSEFRYTGNNGGGNTTVCSQWNYYKLTINNGSETFDMNGNITVTNNLTITAGTLDATASNRSLTVGGNFANAGTFTPQSGTVTLNGSAQQTVSDTNTGTNTFYALTITNTSGTSDPGCGGTFSPGVIFSNPVTTTNTFTITTASVKVRYNSGSTYAFNNINWNGQAAGTRLEFCNSNLGGGTWLLNVTAAGNAQTKVSYVNVARSDASSGSTIIASDGTNVDSSNNTNWQFDETLTLSLDSTSKSFGTIQPGSNPSDQTTTLTATSNSSTGYVIYAWATQLMTETRGYGTISDWTGTNSSPTAFSNPSTGFGYTTDDASLSGTGAADRFTGGGAKYAGFTHTGPGDPVADRTTAATSATNTVSYRLYPSATAANGDYGTTVVYIITAAFP